MSRIQSVFKALKSENKAALIPFVTAGDPVVDQTVEIMHGLVEGGADIIELGVPFSDPMADGPVIQRASERALEHHISLNHVLEMVKEFRKQNSDTPIVLMGYMNPIEVMGEQAFVDAASGVGVDAVLIVDLPPEETEDFTGILKQKDMDQVFLIAPTTAANRIQSICDRASGFVYYVSLKGVTGSNQLDVEAVSEKLSLIAGVTDIPIGVGFGIKDAETAAAVAKISDAVVVGSALVEHLFNASKKDVSLRQEARDFLTPMRESMNAAR